ncbi:MAG: hypothetical protein ABFS38_09595 [Bacteroidota bacterium]
MAGQLFCRTPVGNSHPRERTILSGMSGPTVMNWGLSNGARTYNGVDPQKLKESYYTLPLSVADDSAVSAPGFSTPGRAHPGC